MRYKDHIYYKCEDSKALGCKGAWRLTPFGEVKDPFGGQHKEHTQSLENHTYFLSQANATRQLRLDDLDVNVQNLVRSFITNTLKENLETSVADLSDKLRELPEIGESVDRMQVIVSDLI